MHVNPIIIYPLSVKTNCLLKNINKGNTTNQLIKNKNFYKHELI